MGEDHDYASAQNKFLRSGLSTKPRTVIDVVAESGLRISGDKEKDLSLWDKSLSLVEPRGLKPRTSSLPAKRSNQLSYGPMFELL